MVIPTINMHRFEFIVRNSNGKVIDIGSNDTSLWAYKMWYPQYEFKPYIEDIIFFDCDVWLSSWFSDPKFVRGDAHHLPFKEDSFDTIVFGDVLEHVKNPLLCLQDAKRICKDRIIITLPCESEWKVSTGKSQSERNEFDTYCGIDDNIENQEYKSTLGHPSKMAKCTKAISESKFKHIWHLQKFNDENILELLNSLNMNYNIFKLHYGFPEEIITYGIVLWK